MPRLHLIHVARIQIVASTCVHLYDVSLVADYIVSCIGDKIVVAATCIPLVSASSTDVDRYKLLVRLHVSGVNAALRMQLV